MTRRLAEVARKVGRERGHRQPGPQRQARRVRVDPPGRAHRPRRAGLRAPGQAPRRAGPARRAGAAGAPEPDLPGVRRGDGRRARPARVHARAVHPDRRRHLRGRVRRPPAPAAGVGRRVRRRAVRPAGRAPRPLRAAARAGPADRARQRLDRGPRASRPSAATTRSPPSRRWPTCARSATRAIGVLAGPRGPRAVEPQAARGAGVREPPPACGCPRRTSRGPGTRSRRPRPRPPACSTPA